MPPRIVTARSIGLRFRTGQRSRMGRVTSTVGHYSAGARAKNLKEGIARAKSFHRYHLNQGWAGIGYHYVISDDGAIICCRSTLHTGAHVRNHNSGRIGINMPGTLSAAIRDRPTRRQARTLHWLLHHAHTNLMPSAHRTARDLSRLPIAGHKDLNPTSCPGLFHGMYLRGGERWVERSPGTEAPATDDGFVDLTPRDEDVLEDLEMGVVPDFEADARYVGPDADELDGTSERGSALALPEADDEFDEDLTDLLEEIDGESAQPER